MARTKSRPQAYPAMSFHLIRGIAFVCNAIVSGILLYFCIQLRSDGFKLPWTVLIVLAASLASLITLILTTMFYMCSFLSPLFNLIINSSVFCVQFVGFCLLSYNMSGMLGRSCGSGNWANSDGQMVCHTYKAFYSFAIFALLSQIALIVLDVRSRRNQTKLGRYGNIDEGSRDVKLDKLERNSILSSRLGVQTTGTGGHSHQTSHSSDDSVPYGIQDYADQPTRPAAYQPARYQQDYTQQYQEPLRPDPYSGYGPQQSYYQQQTAYASGGYGYDNGYGGR